MKRQKRLNLNYLKLHLCFSDNHHNRIIQTVVQKELTIASLLAKDHFILAFFELVKG